MRKIAIKMLLGDRVKYLGLIFGVTFSTLLIAQQVSIFISLIARSAAAIDAVSEADIWVMDKRVRYIEEVEPLRDIELSKVRSVEGVDWAVPFYKGLAIVRTKDNLSQQVQLIGVDDVSLIGVCREEVLGNIAVIKEPQSAMIDLNGYGFIWPKEEITLGKEVEINDKRLVLKAICDADPTFFTFPIMYVSYNTAMSITPPARNKMSFILVKGAPGQDLEKLKSRINTQTGLQALTKKEFAWRSINYILQRTGIPINFGITIFLGILIGIAITAQTFYIFIVEKIKQLATIKAIGATNKQLLRLVLWQASIVGFVGYGIGIGLTALFFKSTANLPALKGFILHWQVILGSFFIIALIILGSIIFSLRKVFNLDPAIAFRE